MANPVLWFTLLCGNSSSNQAFWDPAVTINTENPDFTTCFQDTALVWGTCGIFWLGSLIYIPLLHKQPTVHAFRSPSPLSFSKLICNISILATCVADIVHMTWLGQQFTLSKWLVPIIYIFTMVLASMITRHEFCKGENSSGIMFCFWLLLILVNSIKFRTITTELVSHNNSDTFLAVTFYIFFFFNLVAFLLHLFPDNRALKENQERHSVTHDEERTPLLSNHSSHQTTSPESTEKVECPEKYASFLNRILYLWCYKILLYGFKRQLTVDKLWELRQTDKAKVNIDLFYRNWLRSSRSKLCASNREGPAAECIGDDDVTFSNRCSALKHSTWKTNSSLAWAIVRSYGGYFSFLAIYEVFNIILTYVRPVLMDSLITFVSTEDPYTWRGYVYAFTLFAVTMLRAVVNQLHFYGKMVVGLRIRSSISAAVYRKSLLLANSARREYSMGEIVNLMAVDAQRVADATFFIHNLWSAPVNIIVSMWMIWAYLGPSSLAGLLCLLILISSNFLFVSKVKKMQVALMKLKDARTKLTNEVLNGIKVLKLYAWEGAFQKKILGIREKEMHLIKVVAFYLTSTVVSFSCAPVLFTVAAFTVYILTSADATLSAQAAFVSLSLVNSLARPLTFLPNGIASTIQAMVSMERIETFLNDTEIDPDMADSKINDGNVIALSKGTFSWNTGDTTVLHDIEMKIKDGSLTAVVGQVGCGKSSLLSAILGELHKITGQLSRVGSIAYVPQEAWVRNQTLRANVLFGANMVESKYWQTLKACELEPDLKILPAGDLTEIGEKGINLSGGQKQRVSLARAVYQNADIYLMDDPLSAVDAHVGKHIFQHVIGPNGLLKHKTRLLVTHGITHLPKMDQILVIKDGCISECGTYADLISEDGPFAEFMRTYLNEHEDNGNNSQDEEFKQLKQELKTQLSRLSSKDESEKAEETHDHQTERTSLGTHSDVVTRRVTREQSRTEDEKENIEKKAEKPGRGRRLIEDETAQVGGVNWSTLGFYLKKMGYAGILVLVTYTFSWISELASNIWLSEWSADFDKLNVTANETMDPGLVDMRVGVYAALGVANTLMVLLQTVSAAIACYNASLVLHEDLLARIIRAPMSFFDTTPIGRILNRFSQDMQTVDASIRMTVIQMLRGISSIITTIIAISYSSPIFLVAVLPLGIIYWLLQRFYIMSSNQLRRLLSVLTSPIYSHFGETITGATSIRAYGAQQRFINDCDTRIDDMMKTRFASVVTNRWLSIWLEAVGGLVLLFCAVFAVIARSSISAGLVGLSISYSLQVTDRLAFFVRNAADLENNVVAVERIQEYSSVALEAPWHVPGNTPDPDWPDTGLISFMDYSTRYRPGLELVLRKITCTVNGGEKVGVVGRTGAGKSSMTMSLFRIIEALEGAIVIDGVTTANIGLHELRSKLTIIPQDPVLFSGTLRFNLDPFDEKSDSDIYKALELAHLKTFVMSLPDKLEFDCAEGGSNISAGQRQLVCLARALLRKSKILILDEATAAVDLETDELIQNTIRSEFKDCTVITIAHRINTVLDYDRILLMSEGKVLEFDSPSSLLSDMNSAFYNMCKDAGLVATQ